MGTIQTRIDDPSKFLDATATYVNRKISVVMNDNTVVFGNLLQRTTDDFELIDMRGKRIKIGFKNIREIFLDSNF